MAFGVSVSTLAPGLIEAQPSSLHETQVLLLSSENQAQN